MPKRTAGAIPSNALTGGGTIFMVELSATSYKEESYFNLLSCKVRAQLLLKLFACRMSWREFLYLINEGGIICQMSAARLLQIFFIAASLTLATGAAYCQQQSTPVTSLPPATQSLYPEPS